jgi:tRNA (mo5U34)-methyltransferase
MAPKRMTEIELRSAVESFPSWHYEFDLNGIKTTTRNQYSVNRHRERARHFFEPTLKLTGGLAGKRVLDLGCNAGFWSLKAIEAGADFVFGIDGLQMHIDQSNLVFQAKGIDPARYRFEQADVFSDAYDSYGPFDVVLCLDLLDHFSKTMELFEKIAACNTDIVLIDSRVSLLPGAVLELDYETAADIRNEVDQKLVLVPTRRAVEQIAGQFGYATVVLPLRSVRDFDGMHDYRDGKRASFICSKETSLASVGNGELDLPAHSVQSALEQRLGSLDIRLHRRRALRRNPVSRG